jgi:hypothetical protein
MRNPEAPARDTLGVWVYAVGPADARDAAAPGLAWSDGKAVLGDIAGVAAADVRLAPVAGLTALVSDVSLADFGAQELRRNMEDLDWLETAARAHHGVIAAASRLFTLMPVRLATVYTSDESMAAGLGAHAAQLRSSLAWLASRSEWGVKGYASPPARNASPPGGSGQAGRDAGDTAAGTARRAEPGPGAGTAYLRRRRDALAARRESERGAADSAQDIHAELARHAAGSRLHPPQSPQLSGRSEPMVLNGAYLVDDGKAGDFAAAVKALDEAAPALSLELTGPWPPYSFAAHDFAAHDLEQQPGEA